MARTVCLLALLVVFVMSLSACGGQATPEPAANVAPAETIALNAHPETLEGKTVVLRWNSKPNGDKFLTRLADNLTAQVPGITVVRLWEDDPDTVVITEESAESVALAAKIAALHPDLVIASQAD